MADYWRQFLEQSVRYAKDGSISDIGTGLRCAWGNCALPITNAYYLTEPVADAAALGSQMEAARRDVAARPPLPWLFYAPTESVSALGFEALDAVGAEYGLAPFMSVREMTAKVSQLRAPKRPLPAVEYERVTSQDAVRELLAINMAAYGMPMEIVDSSLDSGMFLSGKGPECGILARVNGEPVSTATVVAMNGILYVALVATAPDHRQRGYADAAMRKALLTAAAEFGIDNVALDATAMGEPVYAAMGFAPTGTEWRVLLDASHA
jgi:GNAT superfamily N-acetyltransferase